MIPSENKGGPTDTDMLRTVARVEELIEDGAADDTGEYDPVTFDLTRESEEPAS